MSLLSTSVLGLPIKGWHFFDVETTMKRKADSNLNVKMLHWELEKQMKIYEEIKRQKVQHQFRDDALINNYTWLRRDAPMRPELEMSNSMKREFQELCERTRSSDMNQITATVVRLLQTKEPAPEDVPRIFINVLRSFVPEDDVKLKHSIFYRLISGSLRRLKRTNKIDPNDSTETKIKHSSVGDVEGSSPCRDDLLYAGKSRLHCLINLETETHPMTNFAMPFSERVSNYAADTSSSSCKVVNTTTHPSDREAWTICTEELTTNLENLDYQTTRNNVLSNAGYSCVASDMEVVDLASASSSEEGLVNRHGTCTSLPV